MEKNKTFLKLDGLSISYFCLTFEEGNFSLKAVIILSQRLNDRLETRNVTRGDSLPPSMSSSANSSPIQEERGNNMYNAPPQSSFTPIKVPEGNCPMGHGVGPSVTHTSPLPPPESAATMAKCGSSPGSPNSRYVTVLYSVLLNYVVNKVGCLAQS